MHVRVIYHRRVLLALVAVALALTGAAIVDGPRDEARAQAAVDFFLKIDGIPGESVAVGHAGEIDVESFSWGETNSGSGASGGASAGRVSMNDFRFSMKTSKASPKLFLAAAQGTAIPSATLTGVTGNNQTFIVWELKNVTVSSYKTEATPGTGVPTDEVALKFGQILVTHTRRAPNGTSEITKAGWDLTANKKI